MQFDVYQRQKMIAFLAFDVSARLSRASWARHKKYQNGQNNRAELAEIFA